MLVVLSKSYSNFPVSWSCSSTCCIDFVFACPTDETTLMFPPCLRVQCVTCYGQTQMIAAAGESHPVVLVTPSGRTSLRRSTTQTASLWFQEPTSW